MIAIWAAGLVPIAFVDADHFSGMAGDAAVRKKIRWVGENEVDGGFGNLREEFQAIAVIKPNVVFRVVEGGRGQTGNGFCHDAERSGSDR